MAEKTRVNLYMPTELKDYLLEEGEKLGFNLTTMILIACMEYRKTQQGIELGGLIKALSDGESDKLLQLKSNELRKMLGANG